jgi:hypothetical protein
VSLTYTSLLASGGFVSLTSSPQTVVCTTAVSAGDAIVIRLQASVASIPITSIADQNVTFRQLQNYNDAALTITTQTWYAVAPTNYTPNIVVTWTGGATLDGIFGKVSGFVGYPTPDFQYSPSTWDQTTPGTGVVWSPISTKYPNEIALMAMRTVSGGSQVSGFGTWAQSQVEAYHSIQATAGTNIAVTAGVWSVSTNWSASLAALYDATGVADDLISAVSEDLVTWNSNWVYISPASTNSMKVGPSGVALGPSPSGTSAYYSGTFTADQQVQFVLTDISHNNYSGVGVRLSAGASGPNGYGAWVAQHAYDLFVVTNGTHTSLIGGTQARTANALDTFLLTVQGSTLKFYANGTLLKTATDTTYTSGNPGLIFIGGTPSMNLEYWRAQSYGIVLSPQTITSTIGQLGDQTSYTLGARAATFAEGTPTLTVGPTLSETGPLLGPTLPASGGSGYSSGGSLSWYTFTAYSGGLANALNAYINSTGTVTTFYMGLYDVNGNLLASGGVTPTVGLNTITIPNTAITAGHQYNLAWINVGGSGGLVLANDGSATTYNLGGSVSGVPPPSTLPGITGTISGLGQATLWVSGVTNPVAIFTEGQLLNFFVLTGQTATFTEGNIFASQAGNVTLNLSQQTAQFAEGVIGLEVDYVLDQNTVIIVGQTATFALGVIAPAVVSQFGAYTLTSVEGVPTMGLGYSLSAESATFLEGFLSSSVGTSPTHTLGAQNVGTSLGVLGPNVGYLAGSNTLTLVEGTLTFSATGDFTVSLAGQIALFTEGVILSQQSGDEWVAREYLENAGLVPVVQYNQDPIVPPGHVISQSPTENTVVPVNSQVIMVVSRGPQSPAGQTVMPNLIGLLWKDATDALAANYLSQDKYIWQVNTAQAGSVIAQSVAAGTPVPASTLVQLTLSAGPTIVPQTTTVPTIH